MRVISRSRSSAILRAGSRLRAPIVFGAATLVVALGLLGGASGRHAAQAATGKVSVCATVETDPTHHVGDSADDTAIWLNPTDRSKSTVIGVDKLSGGGLSVYDLSGREKFFYPDERLNNVDIRYNVPLGGQRVTLVGATNRDNGRVDFWKVNESDGSLSPVGSMPTSSAILTPRGFALYHSPVSGILYAFVTDRGHTDQYRLDGSSGQMSGTLVRQMLLHNATEGLVADDVYARVYVAEEDIGGITRYGAEPGDPITGTRIDTTTDNPTDPGHIVQDAKGLTMYYGSNGAGYIIVASQGGDSFHVYDRADNSWKGEFAIVDCSQYGTDKVTAIDGLDVTNANLGPAFPAGMLATQDDQNPGTNQNYKYVPWQSIASALGLIVDATFDPRSIGASTGPDMTAPNTVIETGPPPSTTATSATLSFSSPDPDATGFECALDSGPFAPCTSPVSYGPLAEGSHAVLVRAHDAARNVDPSPARRDWIVVATAQPPAVAPVEMAPASAPLAVTPATAGVVARPTPTPPASASATASATVLVLARTLAAHDRLELRITCPARAAGTCAGSLTLATAKAIALQVGAKRKVVVLGRAAFSVRPGTRQLTRITLSPSGRKLVRSLGSVAVRLTATASGHVAAGAASVVPGRFTLSRRS
jgi:myo-inositol-hexaphosphate 3-phosphohydrolase